MRGTYNKLAVVVLVMMVAGILLAMWMPLWLTPPLLFYTSIVYQCGALLWLPVLVVGILRRPQGNIVAIAGVSVIGIVVVGYIVGAMAFNLASMSSPAFPMFNSCSQGDTINERIRYACTFASASGDATIVDFEGMRGSPFVQLVSE